MDPGALAGIIAGGVVALTTAYCCVTRRKVRYRYDRVSTRINAPPEAVWDVFMDFERQQDWLDPKVMKLSGDPVVGKPIKALIGGTAFKPVVQELTRPSRFVWEGHVLMLGIFDGEHHFDFEQDGDQTVFSQSEQFRGMLAWLLGKAVEGMTKASWAKMNQQLKEEVEKRQAAV